MGYTFRTILDPLREEAGGEQGGKERACRHESKKPTRATFLLFGLLAKEPSLGYGRRVIIEGSVSKQKLSFVLCQQSLEFGSSGGN